MKAHERAAKNFRAASSVWIWGEEALERSVEELQRLPPPYLLVGETKLLSPLRKRISAAWIEAGLEIQPLAFPEGSECCEAQAKAIAAAAVSKNIGTLIGLGGGKCIDTVKWAGLISSTLVATVPGSAATCACASSVVVAHSPSGEVLDLIDLKSAPDLCIADFELLKSAPSRSLAAGMADTLAKWLEWSAVEVPQGPGADEARQAYDIVMEAASPDALVWEASLRLSALASNLGDAPAAAAHSFCAGISLMPESRPWLHGEWVGLGLLFQASLLGQDSSLLKAWLESHTLLSRMPLAMTNPDAIARRIFRDDESIHAMRGAKDLTLQHIHNALSAISE